MVNLLQNIANPVQANIPGSFQEGRQAVQSNIQANQQSNLLQQQLANARTTGDMKQEELTSIKDAKVLTEMTHDVLGAFTVGAGPNRDAMLKVALSKAPPGDVTARIIQDLIDTPDGKEREAKFIRVLDAARDQGLLPQDTGMAKREMAVKETKAETGRMNAERGPIPTTAMGKFIQDNPEATTEDLIKFTKDLKAAEGKTGTGQYSPTVLKKLMDERQSLLDQGADPDSADIQAYNNKINGMEIDIEEMTQDEIDFWGASLNATGKTPSLGRGKQATKLRAQIAKSAAKQALGPQDQNLDTPDKTPIEAAFDVIGTQADTRAIQGSLNFLDKQLSSMGSFVTNLNSQIDKIGELSSDLKTFDTRILNGPLRAVRGKIKGSPLQSKYELYLSEIEREISKLSSGATASVAAMSDAEVENWSKIFDKNLSVKDMVSVLSEAKSAANFRLDSVRSELSKARKRMKTRDYGESTGKKTRIKFDTKGNIIQ